MYNKDARGAGECHESQMDALAANIRWAEAEHLATEMSPALTSETQNTAVDGWPPISSTLTSTM